MDAQDIILGSRVAHVRELRTEVARLKAENAALRDENAALRAHVDMAALAAVDLRSLAPGGRLVLVDGWNLVLGARKEAADSAGLLARARRYLEENPSDLVWVVFDGPRENAVCEGRLRVSYTGGEGPHRADRFICGFVRTARYLGLADRVEVRTNDKDFLKTIKGIMK